MVRLSPFFAVCAANGLNTSLMRSNEIKNGIPVLDEHGNELGKSSIAAQRAVGQVIGTAFFFGNRKSWKVAFGNAIKSPKNKLCDSSDGFTSFGDDLLGEKISSLGEIEGEDTLAKN
jgi:hypothetical protein